MSQTINGRGYIDVTTHATSESVAAATLTAEMNGTAHVNSGATTVLLPAATIGLHYYFGVNNASEFKIEPSGSETISLPSSGVPGAAGKYLSADAVGETVHLMCVKAGNWSVMGYTGTWTAEA